MNIKMSGYETGFGEWDGKRGGVRCRMTDDHCQAEHLRDGSLEVEARTFI
ncbi:hypothetical protein [Algoriphagus confluentis]|uniref:Uncharacterized protein n=1 Tax=Algoriphagus confluentis TaxID=1697556 RepID=A0ABQ6PI60_9BACT|nr:hypothetical protein Aconfl_01910 [Algoriphagus confluentis]